MGEISAASTGLVCLSETHKWLFWLVAKAKKKKKLMVFFNKEDVLCVKS
jgi:hypothetical protein